LWNINLYRHNWLELVWLLIKLLLRLIAELSLLKMGLVHLRVATAIILMLKTWLWKHILMLWVCQALRAGILHVVELWGLETLRWCSIWTL
jgi:hypothetical protein